jgi:hypothetical protein
MTIYSTLRATGYSGPPPNAALFATKPVTLQPALINTGIIMLPVDVVIAGDQPEPFKGRATPLSGAMSAPMRAIFDE